MTQNPNTTSVASTADDYRDPFVIIDGDLTEEMGAHA